MVANDPVIIKDQQGCLPPLGILSLASFLMENTDHEISVIDAQVEGFSHSQLADKIASLHPDIVGLTTMTFTIIDCLETVKEIRKRVKTCIVAGGPHATIYPEECLTEEGLGADYVISGEGENSFLEFLGDYESGRTERLVYKTVRFIEDLDGLPFPARELVPIDKYFSVLAEAYPTTTAMSSRGCPYGCYYCDRPAMGKNFRSQSPNRVVDEMEWCEKHGIKEIFYYDDTFTINKRRVLRICDEYQHRGLKIKWDIRARVNTVDEELLVAIKGAGCTRIHFGCESAVPRVLRELNKGITPSQIETAFMLCHRFGIKTLAYFIIGNPTETKEDMRESLEMAKRLRADFTHVTILTPFPATKLYDMAKSRGIIKTDVWGEYSRNPTKEFIPPLWDEIYSRAELESFLKDFYADFYFRPSYMWEKVKEVKSLRQFKKYFKGALSLVKAKFT